ncbi:hypothetical protein [Nocardia pseudobrasiliensis]|uniref:Uncharacterized protein n=1 Tax=Nocardia pseudobrasiliensis TaxID=45979 RepID=A0A370IDE0_9NOCA|nr:hypothetical protein [Nocardia pseudobrasiliensis]RDI68151.1 hypothetical protein DFR76_102552 [Nocardia pseudobrasiliensis]
MKWLRAAAFSGGAVMVGVVATHPSPLGAGCSGVVAVLALAGLFGRRWAVVAVVAAALGLALLHAGLGSALLGGFGATAYLAGTQSNSSMDVRAGLSGAVLFGAAAALAGAIGPTLPWALVIAPVAALIAVVAPLRAIRAAAAPVTNE